MTEDKVKNLYNHLTNFESNKRFKGAYPIHKKLVFQDSTIEDIYFWILKNISLAPNSKILDAGCGVGFGCFNLAKGYQSETLGISLSEQEIKNAKAFHTESHSELKCSFIQQSYDASYKNKFDLIVAIESLKHSFDVQKTVAHLYEQLNQNGQLLIIDDIWKSHEKNKRFTRFLSDWSLKDIYRYEDYVPNQFNKDHVQVFELDKYLPKKNKLSVSVKYHISHLMAQFASKRKTSLYKIYRGGFILDQYYLEGKMSYQAILIKKTT